MIKSNILVVEDERVVAEDIKSSLLDLGYTVAAIVASGEEAIQKVRKTQPDLVLMDIVLKGKINGIDTAQQIRTRFDIPVIYLTAYADDTTLQRARITEPFGYIIKPFQNQELYSAIEMALYKHKMEKKLKEHERWLDTTLKSIGDGVIATDKEGHITFMNPVAERLTGWQNEQVIGKPVNKTFRFITEETGKRVEIAITKIIADGSDVGFLNHTILQAKDGKRIPSDICVSHINEEGGGIMGIVVVIRDISDRKLAEERILKANKRLQILQKINATVHESLEPQDVFKYITDAIVNKLGFTTAVILTLDDSEQYYRVRSFSSSKRLVTEINKILGFHLQNFSVAVDQIFEDAVKAKTTGKAVIANHLADVASPPLDKSKCFALEKLSKSKSFIMVPLVEKARLIGGIIVTSMLEKVEQEDIAMLETFAHSATQAIINAKIYQETNQAKEIAKETVKRYLELFNEAPVGYHEIGKNGRIVRVNATELGMLGYSATEMIGKYVWDFVEETECRKAVLTKLAGTLPAGKGFERTFRCRDGRLIAVLMEDLILKNEKGQIAGIRSTIQDITERKQVEEKIKMLSSVVEQSTEGMAIADLAGNLIFINDAWSRMHGYNSSNELVGKNLAIFHNNEQIENEVKLFNEKVMALGTYSGEVNHAAKDGKPFPTLMTTTLLKNNEGRPYAIAGIAKDITERKKIEAALAEERNLLRTLIDSLPDYIFIKDRDSRFITNNISHLRLLGAKTQDEVIGKTDLDIFPHELAAQYYADEQQVVQSGEPLLNREEITIDRNGREQWLLTSKIPLRDSKGEIMGLVGIGRDVSKLKQAEEALKNKTYDLEVRVKELNCLFAVLILMAENIPLADMFKKMVALIPPAYQYPEITRARIIYKGQEFTSDHFQEARWKQSEDIMVYNDVVGALEVYYLEERPECDEGPFLKEERNLLQAISQRIRYLLERIQVDEEKDILQTQLLQSQKLEAIGVLASGVAHDFNNMLTAIKGFTELSLMKVKEDDPFHRNLMHIKESAVRAADLTRQLLAFSRKQKLDFKILHINTNITNLLKMLNRLIGEDITIITDLDSELWYVRADAVNIEQVIMNLAVNARDAMPHGGQLTIKTHNLVLDKKASSVTPESQPGNYVCLSIEDTGTGMDEEILKHIFEPFFTTKAVDQGTGLGLSVVYGIIKQHNGWINVASKLGQGSTFKVYLPAVTLSEEVKFTEEISIQELQGNKKRILVVEDDKTVREFALMALSLNGYMVFGASDAKEAVAIFDREKGEFDLFFSDVVLPDISGVELVDQIRKQKPQMPVILSSGYPDKKSQWQKIKSKGYRFLNKPYDILDLLKSIKDETSR